MPACREMSELVTGYLERTLPLRTWLGARWHLLLCPACQRYYAQMRQTVRLLAGRRLPPPESATEAGMLASLRDAGGPQTPG
jgi:hypothetical protein